MPRTCNGGRLESDFNKTFPERAGLTLVVIDAPTPERADQAASELAGRLALETKTISSVRRPDASDFFARNGLLFLDPQRSEAARRSIARRTAVPRLARGGPEPARPDESLSLIAKGVKEKDTTFAAIRDPVTKLAQAFEDMDAGRGRDFSWQEMIDGGDAEA